MKLQYVFTANKSTTSSNSIDESDWLRSCDSLCYSSQVASMRGVSRQTNKLPASNQPPAMMLSKELISPTDIKFVSHFSLLILISVAVVDSFSLGCEAVLGVY